MFLEGCWRTIWKYVKTHILLTEPLPNINRVLFFVLQQERQLSGNSYTNTKVLVNITSQNQWKPSNRDNNNFCYECPMFSSSMLCVMLFIS